jgi:Rrf2 family protein
MRLSHSVAYAVQAALQLAGNERQTPISCGKLAETGHMPERFLLQVLRSLAKQGILQSVRGGTGGFCLSRDPKDISLLDLIEAVEGPLATGLPANSTLPEDSSRLVQDTLDRVVEATRRQLSSLKLSVLAARLPAASANGCANGRSSANGNANGNGKMIPLAVANTAEWGI